VNGRSALSHIILTLEQRKNDVRADNLLR